MAADVTAIAAVARNGVIGAGDDLPWDGYEADLRRFREETLGHPVILGRVTYESIVDRLGGPLPGRQSIVVSESRHFSGDNVRTVSSPASALTLSLRVDGRAYVAGGESIYRALVPLSNRLLITRIPEEPEGDAVFPAVGDDWELVSEEDGPGGLVFVEYRKQADPHPLPRRER
jgi:dihydrofolate reductase